ncbi:MAG TPA: ABC transporter ATP-binding protein [Chthonomonadales bacterium]|nr:ABC transporter ATP-binding protein [Chthonomonadales bacterium]
MIEFEHTSRWYGQVIGVNDVTCRIGPGLTALLGPNGAGKSTLIKLLTGQILPTAGRVRVLGLAPFANPAVMARLGYCPDSEACYDDQTGEEFVSLMASLSGLRGQERARRVAASIDRVGMAPHARRRIGGYSKGMRQRIKIAQALVHAPDLLVLDEPLSGLDPVARHDVSELLRAIGGEGRCVVVSSHILHEVEAMTSSIVLMYRGRLLAQGDVSAIRGLIDRHPHRIVIDTPDGRALARRLLELPYVLSARLNGPDDSSLEVETRTPDAFYSAFPSIVLADGFRIKAFHSPDNTLEAVFNYLVGS